MDKGTSRPSRSRPSRCSASNRPHGLDRRERVSGCPTLLAQFEALLAVVIAAELAACLKRELGQRGQSGSRFERSGGAEARAGGSDCESGAANRKSWRDRTVESPRPGDVEIRRPYLTCRNCNRAYTPYDAGLPDQQRYGWEGLRRPMEATVETSYRRGEEAYPESPSASTLWRRVQER